MGAHTDPNPAWKRSNLNAIDEAWLALDRHAERLRNTHLRDLFAADPDRFATFSRSAGGLLVDFSKEKLDGAVMDSLLALAEAADIAGLREAMFNGEHINNTEDRAVLHTALRDGAGETVPVDGEDVMPGVRAVRDRFLAFADAVRDGTYSAADGSAFGDVVNIGIGGSDLGPAMATQALATGHDGPRLHFVSNVDPAHLRDTLSRLDPHHTLVIVASKTFTTLETMTNARQAKAWLAEAVGEQEAGCHIAALSTNLEATAAFGIDDSRVFGFWDWVGGRYSVWSSIGLPVAIAVGSADFRAFLAGARAMDEHFRSAPPERNLPLLLGLIALWRRVACGHATSGLMPYEQRLARFPAYVQQLDMESNGKRVRRDGSAVKRDTGPIIWGEPGTNAQHSFFQLLHQGTEVVPVDFILGAGPAEDTGAEPWQHTQHRLLVANALAQANALAFGRTQAEVEQEMQARGVSAEETARLAPHRTFPGDRPSTTMLYPHLTPGVLGSLIALFEHKTFVFGMTLGINPYDQWGVELGKTLTGLIAPLLDGAAPEAGMDSSTLGLVAAVRERAGD